MKLLPWDHLVISSKTVRNCLRGAIALFLIIGVGYAATELFHRKIVAIEDSPVITLPTQSHDFGYLPKESVGRWTFVSKNLSSNTLFITRISKSCSCTNVTIDPEQIAPGATFRVVAALSTHDIETFQRTSVNIEGRSGKQLVKAQYQLQSNVVGILEFPTEGHIDLGVYSLKDLPKSVTVTLKQGKYPAHFDEISIECHSGDLSAVASRESGSTDVWLVTFQIGPQGILGMRGYPLVFKFLNHGTELKETLEQQSNVEVRGPVEITPTSLLFGAAPLEHVRKTLSIGARLSEGEYAIPKITGVTADADNIAATYENNSTGGNIVIDYTAPAKSIEDKGEFIVSVIEDGHPYKLRVTYLAAVSAIK